MSKSFSWREFISVKTAKRTLITSQFDNFFRYFVVFSLVSEDFVRMMLPKICGLLPESKNREDHFKAWDQKLEKRSH